MFQVRSFFGLFKSCKQCKEALQAFEILYQELVFDKEDIKGILVFDLHDVLVHADKKAMIRFCYRHFFSTFKQGGMSMAAWLRFLRYYFFGKEAGEGKFSFEGCLEEYIRLNNYDEWMRDKFLELANLQTLDMRMVSLINYAREKGYLVMLASNIGYKTFEKGLALQNNFGELLRSFRDAVVCAEPINGGGSGYVAKPSEKFYMKIIQKIESLTGRPHGSLKILFVDDSLKNCEAARKVGINSLTFKSSDKDSDSIYRWMYNIDVLQRG